MDGHILLGAWLEQPRDATEVRYEAAMGENIYWNLAGTAGQDRADYNVIRAGGMRASAPEATAHSGSETVAYDGSDEADMDFGPGSSGWLNNNTYNQRACVPAGSQCGYTAADFFYTGQPSSDGSLRHPINGTAVHQGYGKGVLFWEPDAQAARFLRYSDILSADSYWLTDTDLQAASQGGCALLPDDPTGCGNGSGSGLTYAQSHLPANYAYNVHELERLQAVNGASKPVVVDVETGCPGGSGACATPPQTVAAAWHALIAGARGIMWFQHDFSGSCQDDRTFIDGSNSSSSMYNCQQTPGVTLHNVVQAVTAFDHEVAGLNGVLLSPTVVGYVSTTGDVSTMVKAYGSSCYVFAGSGQPAVPPPTNQSVTLKLSDHYTGPVTVVDEHRTVQTNRGAFHDTFADANAVHVYRIDDSSTCGRRVQASVSVVPDSFRTAPHDANAGPARAGTTIRYTDRTATTVTFAVDRKASGVERGHRCITADRAAPKHAQACPRFVSVQGSFRRDVRAGRNQFYFTGWVGGRRLARGSYRLDATFAAARGKAETRVGCVFSVIG